MDIYGEELDAGLENGGTINGDLDIQGDLCAVNGKFTGQLDVNTLVVVEEITTEDTMINLGLDNPADVLNLGHTEEYFNTGLVERKWAGLIRDHVTKEHYLVEGASPQPGAMDVNIASLPRGSLSVSDMKSTFIECDTGPIIGPSVGTRYLLPGAKGTLDQVLTITNEAAGIVNWADSPAAPELAQSTGVLTGGELSVNADDTKFDIADGTGTFVNMTTKVVTQTSWSGLTAQSGVYTGGLSYVFLAPGNVVTLSATAPNSSDIRDNIFLGLLGHPNNVNLSGTSPEPMFLANGTNQIFDLAAAIGIINTGGNTIGPSVLLTLSKSVGSIFSYGSNYENDIKDPHNMAVGAIDTNGADVFTYVYQDGSFVIGQSNISPGDYDDGNGVSSPGSVSNNDWATARVFLFGGFLTLMPGQETHNTLADAQASLFTENFVIATTVAANSVLIGYLISRGAATDLNSSGDALFIQAGKFSGSGGGGGGNGDVVGPISSLDNGLVRFDGTSGKNIKDNTGATLSDLGLISAPDLAISGTVQITGGGLPWVMNVLGDQTFCIQNDDDLVEFNLDDEGDTKTRVNAGAQGWVSTGRKARGVDISNPTAILISDRIREDHAQGYDGTAYGNASHIRTRASEAWSVGNHGSELQFSTVDDGTTGKMEKMLIGTAGVTVTAPLLPDSLVMNGWTFEGSGTDLSLLKDNSSSVWSTDGEILRQYSANNENGVNISFMKTRGTIASPAAILDGDDILDLVARSSDGTSHEELAGKVVLAASENWSVGNHGSEFTVKTVDNGTTAATTRLTIETDGMLVDSGDAAKHTDIIFEQDGTKKGTLRMATNGIFTFYDAAQLQLMSISPTTGDTVIRGSVTPASVILDGWKLKKFTVANSLILNKDDFRQVWFSAGSVFAELASNSADSVSNFFTKVRGTIDTPLAIINNDNMMNFIARGSDGVNRAATAGSMKIFANESWSPGNHGAALIFSTVDTGETAEDIKLSLGTFGVKINNIANEYTLPTDQGSAGQVMQTDGAGTATWEDAAGSLGPAFGRVGTLTYSIPSGGTEILVDKAAGNSKGDLVFPMGTDTGSSFEYKQKGTFDFGASETIQWTLRESDSTLIFKTPVLTVASTGGAKIYEMTLNVWITNVVADEAVLAWSLKLEYAESGTAKIQMLDGTTGVTFSTLTDTTVKTYINFTGAPDFATIWKVRFGRFLRLV